MSVRIVSLVPSLTHMLCDLGLRDAVVGCTNFCVKPTGLQRRVKIVGGTKDPDLQIIAGLAPSHILVNAEENTPEHIVACQKLASTYVSFPKAPDDVPQLLRDVGSWLHVESAAVQAAAAVTTAITALRQEVQSGIVAGRWQRQTYLYLIWREPYMVAARDTYIDSILQDAGLVNGAPVDAGRYPVLTTEQMIAIKPDLLLLSSEPYPFRQRDATRLRREWHESAAVAPKLLGIDGQLMSWYGTMTIAALGALRGWVESEGSAGLLEVPENLLRLL